jgi:hypothetical protein
MPLLVNIEEQKLHDLHRRPTHTQLRPSGVVGSPHFDDALVRDPDPLAACLAQHGPAELIDRRELPKVKVCHAANIRHRSGANVSVYTLSAASTVIGRT